MPTSAAQDEREWRPTIRRPRVTLSCRMCKSRKVRCDRKVPVCTQCIKGGYIGRCIYQASNVVAGFVPMHSTSSSSRPISTRPISESYEQSLRTFGADTQSTQIAGQGQDQPLQLAATSPDEQPLFFSSDEATFAFDLSPGSGLDFLTPHANGFSASFYGPTSSVSCAVSFPQLKETLESLTSQYVVPTEELNVVDNLQLSKPRLPHAIVLSNSWDLLPPRFRCDQLLQSYFRHYKIIHRVLHPPVFWKKYNNFWNSPRSQDDPTLYIILAAISCVRCLEADIPLSFDGDGSVSEREASRWVGCAKQWSEQQGLKHTDLDFFQLKCLVMLSQRINLIKLRSRFPSAQTLLAMAMTTALHRSTLSIDLQPSPYETEMRRRIWWAITELDLMECIESGLPSLVQNLFVDIEPPTNALDADLEADTILSPPHLPDSTFTESTFARISREIQPLRYRVSTIVNQPSKHYSMASSEVSVIHDEIAHRLDEMDRYNDVQSSDVVLCRTMLELHLHELLLLLHLPFATRSTEQFNHHHSRFVCQSSARNTIEMFEGLRAVGLSQSSLPRSFLQRAVLVICRMETLPVTRNPIYPQVVDSSNAVRLVEMAFDMYENRILARGNGVRGFWLLFAASCFLRQHQDGPAAAAWKDKVSGRVIALCSKIAMLQGVDDYAKHRQNAVFARFMRHLSRTGVLAGFDTMTMSSTAAIKSC